VSQRAQNTAAAHDAATSAKTASAAENAVVPAAGRHHPLAMPSKTSRVARASKREPGDTGGYETNTERLAA